MRIRPIGENDWPALRALAKQTGTGFTSLQDDDAQARGKFDAGLSAFRNPQPQEEALYLFVLEDEETQAIAGVCAIESAVGVSEPWYNYRLGKTLHASRELGISNMFQTLTMTNDHTGYSELCTLFLLPEYRRDRLGALLSKSRFLFMAEFPQLFSQHLLAEMRGYSDDHGVSPFWEGLGRHFFSMDFSEADRQSSKNKTFIAELLPRESIYVNLLPETAQAVIGKTHHSTTPARRLLESEGLSYKGYCDIFDAGPVLEAHVNDVRAIRESRYLKVQVVETVEPGHEQYLVSNTRFSDFACVLVSQRISQHHLVQLSSHVAQSLGVGDGDNVRVVPLSAQQRF